MIQMQAEKRLCNHDSLPRKKGAFTRLITKRSSAEGMANYVTYVLHSCKQRRKHLFMLTSENVQFRTVRYSACQPSLGWPCGWLIQRWTFTPIGTSSSSSKTGPAGVFSGYINSRALLLSDSSASELSRTASSFTCSFSFHVLLGSH